MIDKYTATKAAEMIRDGADRGQVAAQHLIELFLPLFQAQLRQNPESEPFTQSELSELLCDHPDELLEVLRSNEAFLTDALPEAFRSFKKGMKTKDSQTNVFMRFAGLVIFKKAFTYQRVIENLESFIKYGNELGVWPLGNTTKQ